MAETIVVRRLTAIMFTDIVGYSKLMAADERRALAVDTFHRYFRNAATINDDARRKF